MRLYIVCFHKITIKSSSLSTRILISVGLWTGSLIKLPKCWVWECSWKRDLLFEVLLYWLFFHFLKLGLNYRFLRYFLLFFDGIWFYKWILSCRLLSFIELFALIFSLILLIFRNLKAHLLLALLVIIFVNLWHFGMIIDCGLKCFLMLFLVDLWLLFFPREQSPSVFRLKYIWCESFLCACL